MREGEDQVSYSYGWNGMGKPTRNNYKRNKKKEEKTNLNIENKKKRKKQGVVSVENRK